MVYVGMSPSAHIFCAFTIVCAYRMGSVSMSPSAHVIFAFRV